MTSAAPPSFSDDDFVKMLRQSRPTILSSAGQKQWRSATGCDAVLRLVRDTTKSDEVHEECWLTLTAAMQMTPEQKVDPTCDLTDFVVEKGVMDDISTEFERLSERSTDVVLVDALACLSGLCLLPRHVPRIIQAGIIPKLLIAGEENVPEMIAVYSLISLTNLAIHKEAHDALINAGALQVAERLLQHLESEDESFMDCGLSAAFIICRLAGEDGPGLELIKKNPAVVENLSWILNEVLVAGPNKAVLGANWDPANIVLDVSILSSSAQLRPLMKSFVSLVTTALEKRSKDNRRLVEYSLSSLSQLITEPSLEDAFKPVKDRLVAYLGQKLPQQKVPSSLIEKGSALKGALDRISSVAASVTSEKRAPTGAEESLGVPCGHTQLSWSGTPEPGYCGLGHTRFSWGA